MDGKWYLVVKETGPGRKYLYLQSSRRVPGKPHPKTVSFSLGRIGGDPNRRKRSRLSQVGLALFGDRDDFDRPHKSVLNHVRKDREREDKQRARDAAKQEQHAARERAQAEEKPPGEQEASNKGAGAGNSEEGR